MIRIEKERWLPATFARAVVLCDVLRQPEDAYPTLDAEQKNLLRQSQIEAGEIFRVLGWHTQHALVMKWDQVLGWVSQSAFALVPEIIDFILPLSAELPALEFFQRWQNTPYVWGGLTLAGIDCSGLSQRYYLDVLAYALPKNTYDQRRAGRSKMLADIANHDLVFCTRVGGRGIHHVGIFLDGTIWHAHGERGVICQTLEEFTSQYQVLEVCAYSDSQQDVLHST